ncbi:hypothetical protein K474DRAFT_1678484 [Panus rudis PR-1116 ss-1]|nr:hypothetical protein K474DRAFT_1678484 [Panus rudis PR-1116 ss-1]
MSSSADSTQTSASESTYTLPQHGVVHVNKNVGTIVFTFQSASGPDIPGIVSHFGDFDSGHKRKRRRSGAMDSSDSESSDASSTCDSDMDTPQDAKEHARRRKKLRTCDVCRQLLSDVDPRRRKARRHRNLITGTQTAVEMDPGSHTTVEPDRSHYETIPESQDPRNLKGEDIVLDSQTEDEDLQPGKSDTCVSGPLQAWQERFL